MEFTINAVLYLVAGLLLLGILIFVYVYFNGGVENNIGMLLGILK